MSKEAVEKIGNSFGKLWGTVEISAHDLSKDLLCLWDSKQFSSIYFFGCNWGLLIEGRISMTSNMKILITNCYAPQELRRLSSRMT